MGARLGKSEQPGHQGNHDHPPAQPHEAAKNPGNQPDQKAHRLISFRSVTKSNTKRDPYIYPGVQSSDLLHLEKGQNI